MKILIIYHKNREKKILPKLKTILKNKNISYLILDREKIHSDYYYKGKKLVIVISGDGTFLRAAHFNKDVPMLGINSNPETKEGFFMQLNIFNFAKKINQLFDKKFELIKLLRLEIEINSVKLNKMALNEVFIGDGRPYNMFNYELTVKCKREFQRSSGILISTPSGSHAWLKSAGGKAMNLIDDKFQFIARELYQGRITKNYCLPKAILKKDQIIKIVCRGTGILVLDSLKTEHVLKSGDRVKIYVSKNYLPYVRV